MGLLNLICFLKIPWIQVYMPFQSPTKNDDDDEYTPNWGFQFNFNLYRRSQYRNLYHPDFSLILLQLDLIHEMFSNSFSCCKIAISPDKSVLTLFLISVLKCWYSTAQVGSSCVSVTLSSGGRPLGNTRSR